MFKGLLQLTSIVLLAATPSLGQESLQSARQALTEELPDLAALRIESFLKGKPELTTEEKQATYLLLGESHLRAENPTAALAALAKAPNDKDEHLHFWQGLALAHQGNYPLALEKLASAKESHPFFPQALFNIVEIQQTLGNNKDALLTVTQLREFDPQFRALDLTLLEARLFLQANEPTKARKALSSLSKDAQNQAQSLLLKGKIELAAGNASESLKAFSAIDTAPQNPSFNNLVVLGKIDGSLASSQNSEALTLLLSRLSENTSPSFLKSLSTRFEKIILDSAKAEELTTTLTEFVSPSTLGEDGNLATPEKLLATYYLSRISPPDSARALIAQALTFTPEAELTARLQLESARIAWDEKDSQAARQQLEAVRQTLPDSALAARAADLLARLATKDDKLADARSLFEKAALHPEPDFAEQALLNLAVIELTQDSDRSLSALAAKLQNSNSLNSLALEKALAAGRKKAADATTQLQDFIAKNPTHFRLAEARLALIKQLLAESQPNLEGIARELASLPTDLEQRESRQAFELSHHLAAITGDWEEATLRGENHLKAFPVDEEDPYFLLRLAESNFRDEDFNRAHLLFSKTATLPEAGELAEVALFYSARANLSIPTEKTTIEGLEILDRLINQSARLATSARLLKARTLLKDSGKPRDCLKALEGIPGNPGDQPEAAFLTAEAYRELATEEPELVDRAVSIYQKLIDDPRTSYPLSNELHYQMALTYRENGLASLAIEPCQIVVNGENRKAGETETEWDYYYRCGFEAIDILLENKRARAALLQARKLAATKGPGAKQAQERARQIQLDHQLFNE